MVRKVYVNKQLPFGPTVCMPLFCAQCMCRCIGIITLSRTIVRQISFTILIIAFLVIGFLGFAECQQLLYLDSLLIGCELLDQGSLSCRQDGRPQFLPLLWIPSKCKPTYLHPISWVDCWTNWTTGNSKVMYQKGDAGIFNRGSPNLRARWSPRVDPLSVVWSIYLVLLNSPSIISTSARTRSDLLWWKTYIICNCGMVSPCLIWITPLHIQAICKCLQSLMLQGPEFWLWYCVGHSMIARALVSIPLGRVYKH
jgi:hypothetical protein